MHRSKNALAATPIRSPCQRRRIASAARQAQHARSILEMNDILALDAVLPQRDGFVSLAATGRTGREAPSAALRAIAIAIDQALLHFIETATSRSGDVNFPKPAGRGATVIA